MLDPVTHRYAEALFNLAKERGELDAVRRDVEGIARTIADPAAHASLLDARISIDKRRAMAESLITGMNQLVQSFVLLLFDKRREQVLPNLGAAFHQRSLDERRAAEGVVESARPLGASEIAQLAQAFGRRLGKDVSLENRVVPGLLGGIRVIVGSKMIDHSLQGRLSGLRKTLLEAPLPHLQEV
jgi:F-type H+-transporting ATPase subunit delta